MVEEPRPESQKYFGQKSVTSMVVLLFTIVGMKEQRGNMHSLTSNIMVISGDILIISPEFRQSCE